MAGVKVPDGIIGNKFSSVRTASGDILGTDLDLISVNPLAGDITLTIQNDGLIVTGRAFTIHNESLLYKATIVADDATVIGYVLPSSIAIFKSLQDNPTTFTHWKNIGLGMGGNQSDIYNLGITYAAGVFTVTDSQGNPLSATNYGSVLVPSVTAGQTIRLKVTSGGSFNDDAHASSSLTNMGWGITETANWANDRPFFLYVVNRANSNIDGADGSSMFFISDIWNLSTTPAAANSIGDTGAIPVTDAQGSILIMDDVTVADYVSLPCKLIGAFRMQWSTATDDWTVQALTSKDGVGEQALNATFATEWTLPVGQMGAEAGKHYTTSGGATALTFAPTNSVLYYIKKDGTVICSHVHEDQSANGATVATILWILPYIVGGSLNNFANSGGKGIVNNIDSIIQGSASSAQSYGSSIYTNPTNTTALRDSNFENTSDSVHLTFIFKIQ